MACETACRKNSETSKSLTSTRDSPPLCDDGQCDSRLDFITGPSGSQDFPFANRWPVESPVTAARARLARSEQAGGITGVNILPRGALTCASRCLICAPPLALLCREC